MSPTLPGEIAALVPERGVAVWWPGQAGVVIRGRSATIAIDPFLTDYGSFGRLYEPPCRPDELHFLDVLVGTHDHIDHIDPLGFPALLAASTDAVGVVPAAALSRVAALVGDSSRLVGASVGVELELAGARFTPLPAVHAPEFEDGYGFHRTEDGEYPFLGFVIEIDGVRIAHTGDTLVYEGLPERLAEADLDLLIVPINGASWF